MSRYRKIDVRTWGDAAFRRLSTPNPSAQFLWFYLLTNPHTTSIPGLYRLGEAAAAEELGWPLEGFREAFREVIREGLVKFDGKARLILIPGAVKYNPPESPNVVKSWRAHWDELPECELKTAAYKHFSAVMITMSEGFQKAFREACPKPFGKAMANQEQEQELNLRRASAAEASNSRFEAGETPPAESTPAGTGENGRATPPASGKPYPPDAWDAILTALAEVTGRDRQTAGAVLGKVGKALGCAKPPYTPAEVREFGSRFLELCPHARGKRTEPTPTELQNHIGLVRSKKTPIDTRADDTKKLLAGYAEADRVAKSGPRPTFAEMTARAKSENPVGAT